MIGFCYAQLIGARQQFTQGRNCVTVQRNHPCTRIGLGTVAPNLENPLEKINILPTKPLQLASTHGRIQRKDCRALTVILVQFRVLLLAQILLMPMPYTFQCAYFAH